MWWPYYWHPISLHYTGWSYSIRVVKGWKPWELRSCRSDENTCSQMMRDGETTIIVGGVDRKTWMRKRWRTRKIMDLWEAEEGSAKTAFKVAKSKNLNCCPKLNSFSLPPRKVIGFWILDFFEMNERWSKVIENHRKSIIQNCERSELRLHFEWTKVNWKCQKWSILASFWKAEACGQTALPDMSFLVG